MELAEKLVKKAATECSVCNEALVEVIKKRVARGEDLRAVTNELAQAITIEVGAQIFSPNALRQRFLRETTGKTYKKPAGPNRTTQESEPGAQGPNTENSEAGDEEGANEDVFLKCNLNSANEDASTMTKREINARRVIRRAEVAVECRDDVIKENMIRGVCKLAKEIPQLDLADEINEALDAAVYAFNLAVKVNKVLEAVLENVVIDKAKLIYNNANGNFYESQ